MRDSARRVGLRDLGVSSEGIGAEAILHEDGDLVIEATPFDGGQTDRLTLEKDQAPALVAWLVNRDELAHSE